MGSRLRDGETLPGDSFWGPAGAAGHERAEGLMGVCVGEAGEWREKRGGRWCAVHCAVLSCDCTGYNPSISLSLTLPPPPLCEAMCPFNSGWGGLGVGTRCVCVEKGCVLGGWVSTGDGLLDPLTG